ncbi:MAG: DUF2795 domain-containing protein [Ignavibacteria bacterium]|nr:DUF2795 domain-containing protein [Bacteroidota bacterium]MSQ45789.1 DUF2795 domain-containing protein [Ignavibacteria bacterium]
MIWTTQLASYLEDAPWPATKEELIEYAIRTGCPNEVAANLSELEDNDQAFESMEEIWLDYPSSEDYYPEDEEEY